MTIVHPDPIELSVETPASVEAAWEALTDPERVYIDALTVCRGQFLLVHRAGPMARPWSCHRPHARGAARASTEKICANERRPK